MRVLLNATDGPLSIRAVRRYVREMAAGLADPASGVDVELAFFTHRIDLVRRFLGGLPRRSRYRVRCVPLPRAFLSRRHRKPCWELRALERGFDLYHETTIDNPFFEHIPVVTTIHGLCPIVRPDLLDPAFAARAQAMYERTVALSDYFAPVSETSRGEFLERFGVPAARVRAIPLGVSAEFHPVAPGDARAAVAARFGWTEPYVLYAGGVQPNKNIPLVLRTFRRLRERDCFRGLLVLAGDIHYAPAELASLLAAEGITDAVRCPGYIDPDDARLASLYQGAELFLFPSFYEGWTSPPLEAMACGVPVVASSVSSIPETVGNGALLADPTDEDAWVSCAAELLVAGPRRAELIARGTARAAQFPWSRTVAATRDFYADICAQREPSASRLLTRAPVNTLAPCAKH